MDANTEAAMEKINAMKAAAASITTNLEIGNNAVDTAIKSNKTKGTSDPVKQSILVQNNNVWSAIV